MDTDFQIKTHHFEGPLELLLELIEKRKLHISDFSLSQVADDFISHVKSYEEFPIGDSADFILIASTLLLIKSKSLLPNLELTEEEQGNIKDLEKRLALYKVYKNASLLIKEIFGESPLFFAGENKIKPVIFSPTAEISLGNISRAIEDIINNAPKTEILPKISVKKIISLEEMINSLSKRVEKSIKMSFGEFSGKDKNDKVLVIVSFLAMLELVKQGVVRVNQENHFDDIEIERESLGVPNY